MRSMIDNPTLWGILAVVLAPGGVGFLWVVKKLRLSNEAADAVARDGDDRPRDYDQALILLASRIEELSELKVAFPLWVGFGRRGWQHVPVDQREPEPPLPKSVSL